MYELAIENFKRVHHVHVNRLMYKRQLVYVASLFKLNVFPVNNGDVTTSADVEGFQNQGESLPHWRTRYCLYTSFGPVITLNVFYLLHVLNHFTGTQSIRKKSPIIFLLYFKQLMESSIYFFLLSLRVYLYKTVNLSIFI